MSVVVESGALEGADDPRPVRFWRRRWLWVSVAAVVALAIAGAALGTLVYVNTYQPLATGSFFSTGGLHARALTDGINDTQIIVIGPAGTQARMEYSLSNDGSHDVRIPGLASSFGIDRIMWGPAVDAHGVGGGTPAEVRPFPLTLRAGRQISLWVYVTQPNCKGGGPETFASIPLRWVAFGVHHIYQLALDGAPFLPITNCPPAKALKYIDHL